MFNKKRIIIGVLVVLMLIGGITYFFINQQSDNYLVNEENDLLANEVTKENNQNVKVKAEVKGEVVSPGVYELDEGSRLQDLIDAAGGFSSKAYYDNINLSMKLKDEMVLVVYDKDKINKNNNVNKNTNSNKNSSVTKSVSDSKSSSEQNSVPEYNIDNFLENGESVIEKSDTKTSEEVKTSTETTNNNDENINNASANSLVNINTAGIKELSTLTGIGEAKAQKIIDYRKANGGFKSIDEIMKVKGIGKATYEKFKANITV